VPGDRAPLIRAPRPRPRIAIGATLALALLLTACGSGSGGSADGSAMRQALTITIEGDGDVGAVPSGIDCGPQCSADYPAGTAITLFATPAGDARFEAWDGDCDGSGDCRLTMDRPHQVRARFVAADAIAPAGQWLKGDLHVHDDHSSDGSLPRQVFGQAFPGNLPVSAQIAQAQRVGLDFLMLTDHRTYDQHYDPLWRADALLLIAGEEANGSPHATVHGAVDSIVQGANPPGAPEFARVQQSIWDAHAQDAVWVTAHPDDGETGDDGTPNARASAQGIDLVEAWNRASSPDAELDYCENRWNAGFRFGIAGASDNHFKELWAVAGPGSPTTEVFTGQASERGILDALHRGHVRITPGAASPLVTLEADLQDDGIYEAIGGDELVAAAGTPARLRIHVQHAAGSTVLLYRSPGRSAGALQTFHPSGDDQSFIVDIDTPDTPQWYRAEVRGPGLAAGIDTSNLTDPGAPLASLRLLDQLRAIASPIFIGPQPAIATPELALPAALGSDDGALLVGGARGRFSGFADIATAGDTHLVMETHAPDASRIVYRRLTADGQWRNTPLELSGDSTTARFPRIAARGDDVFVTWQDEPQGQIPRRPAIRLRRSHDAGASWSAIETIRAIDGRCEHPVIAIDAAGRPVLAWQEITPGAVFDVMVQTVGADDTPTNLSHDGKTPVAASTFDARAARDPASVWPSLAIAGDGRMAVAWQDNRGDADPLWTGTTGSGEGTDPDDWQILVRHRASSAVAWSAPLALGGTDRADRHPALAFAADGRLVLAWDSKELHSSGVNLSVQAAVSADGGDAFGAPQTLAPDADAMSQYPRLGRDADGRVRAVWYDSRAADWRWRVMTARLLDAAWDTGTLLLAPGIDTWPATDGGRIVFSSTRRAQRLQRDRTQQIYVVGAPP
jgi:predicted metal-dependent phosphoesterase TrpH